MNDIFNKKIITSPKPEVSIGVDTEDKVVKQVAEGENPDGLQSLMSISIDRDMQYNQVDDMCNDSRIASILEVYTEDTACIGDDGRIVYVDSTDANVSKMITHFLDAMNIDKYIYSWAYALIKYGDVYVRLFHESETSAPHKNIKLNEDVKVEYFNPTIDHYSDYCQQVLNPAEMFELKKFGQTYAYIQCPLASLTQNNKNRNTISYFVRYKDADVKIFQPQSFVHGSLNQAVSRVAETIELFSDGDEENTDNVYTVNKGQSLFYNIYPIWRQMQLLENAMLLNRINRAAILRVMNVEVGNITNEEEINSVVTAVSNMLQTKMSLSTNTLSQLYNSDQPTVNYAVMPTKNGAGALSTLEIGGDAGENNLDDIDYFKNKLFSALRVPKALVGDTGDEAAGFDAGGSLAQQSYRYGKAVRRVQNVLIQMITDMMNLRLLDRGLEGYINKFQIKMHFPVTQEDTINQSYKKNQVDFIIQIMDSLDEVVDDAARVRVLRYLLPTVVDNNDVLNAVTEELEKGAKKLENSNEEENMSSRETSRQSSMEFEEQEEEELPSEPELT